MASSSSVRNLFGPLRILTVAALALTLGATAEAVPAAAIPAAAIPAAAHPAAPTDAAPTAGATPLAGSRVVSDRHTVTLITGDVVAVGKNAQGRPDAEVIRRAPGTETVAIFSNSQGVFAIPGQALPYLTAGELDRRLFDVSLLVADGYDDAHAAATPLIAAYTTKPGAAAMAVHAAPAHASAVRQLTAVSGAALSAPKAQASDF